jgi:RNA polymerase sigma factor (sigma-70 family)
MQQNYPTDGELALKVKQENCSDAMSELISRHTGIVADIARRFCFSKYGSGLNYNEVVEEAPYLLWRAATSYNDERGTKFSSWAGNKVRYELLSRRKELLSEPALVELTDELAAVIPNPDPEQISADDEEAIESIKNSIKYLQSDEKRSIIQRRYFSEDCPTLKQVGDEFGYSAEYIRQVAQKFVNKQKQKIKNNE